MTIRHCMNVWHGLGEDVNILYHEMFCYKHKLEFSISTNGLNYY